MYVLRLLMQCLIFRGWGLNPLHLVPPNPQVCIVPPKKIVKISQKYIADPPPPWFSHKSSTEVAE